MIGNHAMPESPPGSAAPAPALRGWTVEAMTGALLLIILGFMWSGIVTIDRRNHEHATKQAYRMTSNLARALEEHTVRTLRSVDQLLREMIYSYQTHGKRFDLDGFIRSRGLDSTHLRLSRASTRIWTRRAERAQPEPARPAAGTLQRPDLPVVVDQGPPPTRDTEAARDDVVVDGFALVGIDRDTAVGKGEPRPDGQDAALVEFAKARSGAIALLRGVTDEGLKVYCLAVEESVDSEAARRELAGAAAAAGLHRAAVEAFAPAGAISAFHLDLAVGTTRLWPIMS